MQPTTTYLHRSSLSFRKLGHFCMFKYKLCSDVGDFSHMYSTFEVPLRRQILRGEEVGLCCPKFIETRTPSSTDLDICEDDAQLLYS